MTSLFRPLLVNSLAIAALAGCSVDEPSVSSTSSLETVTGSWAAVPTPGAGVSGNPAKFNAAVAISPTDAWAFGQIPGATGGSKLPLAEHWDGTAWTIRATPSIPGSTVAVFSAAAGLATNDVWAVGYVTTTANYYGTSLIEHWNGRAWRQSRDPESGLGTRLNAISATSSSDVWAVGQEYLTAGGQYETYVVHYDGRTWTSSTPFVGSSFSTLYSVKAISAEDVWALGSDYNTPIALHWDGTTWTQVAFPVQTNPPTVASFAQSIDGAASNDIWAMGHNLQVIGYEGDLGTFAQAWHWNGTQWSIVAIPGEINGTYSAFSGVTAQASDDVWALGQSGGYTQGQQVAIHYDGSSWTQVASPATGNYFGFNSLASSPSGDVWAVGTTDYTFSTFAMHYTE